MGNILIVVGIVLFAWFQKWALGWTWPRIAMMYGAITMAVAVALMVDGPVAVGIVIVITLSSLPIGGYLAIRDHKLASAKDQS